MPLLTLRNSELSYGLHPLLDRAQFSMEEGERIGLIGRNGTGKSTLLKIMARQAPLDDGEIVVRDGLCTTLVAQEPVLPPAATVRASLLLRGRFDYVYDDRECWRLAARLGAFLHRLGVAAQHAPE